MLEMVTAAIDIEMTTSISVTADEHRRRPGQLVLAMFIYFATSILSYAASRDRMVSINLPGAWGLGRKFKPSLRSMSFPTTCRL